MHAITKMAQPKVASHKLKHGFSCSIISRELAERYRFHVCIPCQNFQDKQREVAVGMVRKNAVVEQRGSFACNCRPHTHDFGQFGVTYLEQKKVLTPSWQASEMPPARCHHVKLAKGGRHQQQALLHSVRHAFSPPQMRRKYDKCGN
jgi:hypothetical protein